MCHKCPASGTVEAILLLGALVFLGIFTQTVRLSLKHSVRLESSKGITTTSLKIMVAFVFETALLASYQLDWGSALRTLFGLGSAAATGDVTSIALTGCLGIDLHLKMKCVFAAPFLALLLPLPAIGWAKWRSHARLCGATLRSAYVSTVIIALWLLHPAVLGECVLALETLRVGEREYVAADLSVETSDPAYATTRSLAIVLLCTYVPLFPCCVFGALYRYRHHLRSEEAISRAPAWVRQRLYYFYGSFKPEFFLWEGVGFVHKALLAVIAAKASVVLEPGVPLFVASWVVLSQFVLEVRYQAYDRKLEGRLVKITLFGLLALMLAAQGLAVATLAGDTGFQEATRVVAGIAVVGIAAYCVMVLCPGRKAATKKLSSRLGLVFGSANPLSQRSAQGAASAPAPAPAPAPRGQRQETSGGFKVAAVMDRAGAKQPSEDGAPNQRSWSTFNDASNGGDVPMQTNPMASARESDLSRRAREIYATTAPARDNRAVSTIEKPQKAEL